MSDKPKTLEEMARDVAMNCTADYDDDTVAIVAFGRLVAKECAEIARTPYSDEVKALAGNEPATVGYKIMSGITRRFGPWDK